MIHFEYGKCECVLFDLTFKDFHIFLEKFFFFRKFLFSCELQRFVVTDLNPPPLPMRIFIRAINFIYDNSRVLTMISKQNQKQTNQVISI